jgi:hypothetical protein
MKSYAHLKPGQNGTKRLLAQYGKALLCVRYRYDVTRGVRLKTVEHVEEEKPGCPMFLFQDSDMVPVEAGTGCVHSATWSLSVMLSICHWPAF